MSRNAEIKTLQGECFEELTSRVGTQTITLLKTVLSWSNICFWASGLLFMNLVWLHGEAGEMIQNLYPRCASAGRMNMDNLFFNLALPPPATAPGTKIFFIKTCLWLKKKTLQNCDCCYCDIILDFPDSGRWTFVQMTLKFTENHITDTTLQLKWLWSYCNSSRFHYLLKVLMLLHSLFIWC